MCTVPLNGEALFFLQLEVSADSVINIFLIKDILFAWLADHHYDAHRELQQPSSVKYHIQTN